MPDIRDSVSTVCDAVLADRYLAPGETGRDQVFRRVARALAEAEPPDRRRHAARQFYGNMLRGAIGAGRIMANAGTSKIATMVNCFVHPIVGPDVSVAGQADIARALAQATTTLRMGGGVGYDFSPVAPADALVSASDSGTGDVCDVIERFDLACKSLAVAETRGGAQMAVLRCDHPDLDEFVNAKRGRRRWTTFNVSVAVSTEFMTAVARDAEWRLQHRAAPNQQRLATGAYLLGNGNWCYATVPARRLWARIVDAAHESAEPGLLFIDTIRESNDLADIESIAATNPCGEQPLPAWGSCVLGPIDLSRRVRHPFGAGGMPVFDFAGLARLVHVQVRMLDNAIDVTQWPLPEHGHEARSKRRIGVGVTGLADALTMMCLRYDAPQGRDLASAIGRCLRDNAYAASAALAHERGAYPLFRGERSLSPRRFALDLPDTVRDDIARHGLRNSHLLSVAPTGSVSLAFGGNCSSGIEPAFDWAYQRQLRLRHQAPNAYCIENHAYRRFRALCGERAALPDYFVTASQVSGDDHLRMVAAMQPFIDAGISKTVLVPSGISREQVGELLYRAWQLNLKGVTIFRPGRAADAVLSVLPTSAGRPACFC
ncbi:adenosylcobalamin-dependent ribonucleoside-diphosphate reductase [Pandoraea terrigena]|uniref:Vitamin B12-dependent ribonucleotide reductase n=1 Tax=Pandoraea terrigena TaxID=2508292 RepID=A0A5E4WUM7_9BURK|nr:adenosylcobalamin-dependent ribonucleoside-diphosphate reductase [Pandoraea terrigena]VVE27420.1 Vitamin B12-dependent ribonucleoside-diphosphate reductase [Pandoraea terrigena]